MKNLLRYGGIFLCLSFCLFTLWAVSNFKMHDFEGKCTLCHSITPDKNNPQQNLVFVDAIDTLCSRCHTINQEKSHPVKVRPEKDIPLAGHLDKDGLLTCTTCHDVHKEDKTKDRSELPGLLWGHVRGRAFCSLCHNKEALDARWRHQTAIPYAHSYGKLIQDEGGSLLDKYSTECLSCHDGTISKVAQVEVRQGVWQHGIGESHPIGVDYPRSGAYASVESLPEEIRLFDGKIGCLSCHEIYNKEPHMLVMNNRKSRLCFTCHKK